MIPFPNPLTIIKYGFISAVITSAGFLIGNVLVLTPQKDAFVSDLVYRPRTSLPLEGGASVFDRDISKCFTEPSKTFCLSIVNESLQAEEAIGKLEKEYYDGGNSDNSSQSTGTFHGHPIHHILSHFSKFMASLNIRPLLLEPSILYCALSPGNKITLLKKGLNPYDLQGSRLMITVGIFEEASKIFDLVSRRLHILNNEF
ncbi:uncharacterized protein CDAR_72911 [Caerostris darwini]|uniref:Uncharacterized protein n=1 Tax=Caerostris darwini TaxID=1538125 RepID=A0AAV4VPK8_9ARAC|nr:uncharacterized protein CDAR_72911 [Caerostris darwini]